MTKRYESQVDLTVRIPKRLHQRAVKLVRKLQDKGLELEVPETDVPVRPSLAVLALRGLLAELEVWEALGVKKPTTPKP